MKLKSNSVNIAGIRPELLFAVMVADKVYSEHGVECVITSVTDSKHGTTSLHYAGCAVDLRTSVFKSEDYAKAVSDEIRQRLNIDYDVIFEGDHIHIEWQPRYRG